MSAEVVHFPVRVRSAAASLDVLSARCKPLTPALEIFFTGLHDSAQRFVIASSERFTAHPLVDAETEAAELRRLASELLSLYGAEFREIRRVRSLLLDLEPNRAFGARS